MQWAIVILVSLLAGGILGRMSRLAAEAAARRRRVLSPSQIEQARVSEMIGDRCQAKAPAVVVDPASGHAVPCRFEAFDDTSLRMSVLAADSGAEGLQPNAMAAVQFNLEGRARMFIAPILEVGQDEEGRPLLEIATPAFVADGETRGAFRVTISEDFEVSATVLHGANDYSVRVVDLSTTGAGIVFGDDAPQLAVGDELELRLSVEGQEAQRTAIVRRVDGLACGLSLHPGAGDTAEENELVFSEFIRGVIDQEAKSHASR